MGKQWRPCRLSFLVPDLSPARCARRLVTRGFAARATSFITTKMRACSQASYCLIDNVLRLKLQDDTAESVFLSAPSNRL